MLLTDLVDKAHYLCFFSELAFSTIFFENSYDGWTIYSGVVISSAMYIIVKLFYIVYC